MGFSRKPTDNCQNLVLFYLLAQKVTLLSVVFDNFWILQNIRILNKVPSSHHTVQVDYQYWTKGNFGSYKITTQITIVMFLKMHYYTCHKIDHKYHHDLLCIGCRIQILQLINNASGNYSIPFHSDIVNLAQKPNCLFWLIFHMNLYFIYWWKIFKYCHRIELCYISKKLFTLKYVFT